MTSHNHDKSNEIEKELAKIYQEENGELVDLTTIIQKKRAFIPRWVLVTIAVLSVACAIAWAGFVMVSPNSNFRSDKVELSILGPLATQSGTEVDYTISIKNKENVTLTNPKLEVKIPKGFEYISSTYPITQTDAPGNITSTLAISLPDIKSKETLDVHVKGKMIGEKGFVASFTSRLLYTPLNYSSDFEAQTSFSSTISDSALALTVSYPEQIIKNENVAIAITLKNTADIATQTKVSLKIIKPESFTITDVKQGVVLTDNTQDFTAPTITPDEFNKNPTLEIAEIKPGEEIKYVINGEFTLDTNTAQDIEFHVITKDAAGQEKLQTQEKITLQVIATDLVTNLIINGETQDGSVNFGDTMSYLLTIKNKSTSAISDVAAKITLTSSALDWKSLQSAIQGIVSNNQILWTKEQIKELAVMLPEDEVQIAFTIKTKQATGSSLDITSQAEVTIGSIDTIEVKDSQKTALITHKFNSDVALYAQGLYFDGQGVTLGSGPLPPRVNETTTYVIEWKLTNSLHELSNIAVSAQIPTGVQFVEALDVTSGDIVQNGDKVIWNLTKFPTTLDEMTARFKVSVKPTAKDANTLLTLLNATYVTATDAKTSGSITIQNPPITTKLNEDSGLVQD
ncbi:hypothetical protein IT409_02720 [Candidatus Falkowbacteria bacterium]|nr:hypothetical protein [Candidatus Falkowbacteria bacterium]